MFQIGDRIDQYRLTKVLGTGSYGMVFAAENRVSRQSCALKLIPRCGRVGDRELRALRKYHDHQHPNLLKIYHSGIVGDYLYYTMELAEGTLLNQHLPPDRLLDAAIRIADATAFLHDRGLIHRDIKPDNLFWLRGEPVLGDISLLTDRSQASMIGTPGFLPPSVREKGEAPSEQSDLYALAKTFYCLLSGEPPSKYPRYEGSLDPAASVLLQTVISVCDGTGKIRTAAEFRDRLTEKRENRRFFCGKRFLLTTAVLTLLCAGPVFLFLTVWKKKPAVSAVLPQNTSPAAVQENMLTFRLPHDNVLEMIRCPAGSYLMGASPDSPEARYSVEQHMETIARPFYLGRYEVTQAQYLAVMGQNPSFPRSSNFPVTCVTGQDAMRFCVKLNFLLGDQLPKGYMFSLPTTAEWEWAACGADPKKPFLYAGSNDCHAVAWHFNNCEGVQPVGLKKPNQLGMYDLSGNVFERCFANQKNRKEKGTPNDCRGGAWCGISVFCRPAANAGENKAVPHVGFRVALIPGTLL